MDVPGAFSPPSPRLTEPKIRSRKKRRQLASSQKVDHGAERSNPCSLGLCFLPRYLFLGAETGEIVVPAVERFLPPVHTEHAAPTHRVLSALMPMCGSQIGMFINILR